MSETPAEQANEEFTADNGDELTPENPPESDAVVDVFDNENDEDDK